MAVSYISYRGKGYLVQDDAVQEIRSGGEVAPIPDLRLRRRVLARGRLVGEPEAIILAYRSGDDPPQKKREHSEESDKARNWLIAFALMVLPVVILALAFDSGLGFFVEVTSFFIIMPAFLFAAAFVAVVAFGLSILVIFALRRFGRRFGT